MNGSLDLSEIVSDVQSSFPDAIRKVFREHRQDFMLTAFDDDECYCFAYKFRGFTQTTVVPDSHANFNGEVQAAILEAGYSIASMVGRHGSSVVTICKRNPKLLAEELKALAE